jgi:ABC-2 type transport system ATP-binding protein
MFNELVNLKELYNKPVRSLSLGQRMLCDIAAAFLHNPRIIFLDEPTIGLDVDIRAKVRHIIGELNRLKNTTVILTSHDVGDIETLAKRIIMIDKGKILYDGRTEHFNLIFGAYRTLRLDVHELDEGRILALQDKIRAAVNGAGSLEFHPAENGWLSLTFEQDKTPLLSLLPTVLEGTNVRDIKVEDIEMEEVIKRVYAGALR